MKLSEMVQLDKKPSQKVPNHLKDLFKQTSESIAKEWGKKSWHDDLRNVWERNRADVRQNQILRDRVKIFEEMGTLPKGLELPDKNDPLSIASQSPRVRLSEIRRVADELSSLVMPFDYINEDIYKSESENVKAAIHNFNGKMRGFNSVYVICPVVCYDVMRHIRSEKDAPIYAGKDNQQAFMAISMMVPVHRAMHSAVRAIGEQMEVVTKRTIEVEDREALFEEEMKSRLNELNRQNTIRTTERIKNVSKEGREWAMKNIEKVSQALGQLSAAISSMLASIDPLMFAIPKNASINDEAVCIVGPCWGGDFDDIAMSLLGFKNNVSQRKLVDESAGRWSCI